MILSTEERLRFCQYLREAIYSSKLIAEQMDKLNMITLAKMERVKYEAKEIVLRELESIEEQVITGGEP